MMFIGPFIASFLAVKAPPPVRELAPVVVEERDPGTTRYVPDVHRYVPDVSRYVPRECLRK